MTFQLAIAQFAPQKGQLAANLDQIAEIIRQAASEGADLVHLPESATTGYILERGIEDLALSPEELRIEIQKRLQGLNQTVDFSIGFYEKSDGRPYNSAAYFTFQDQQLELLNVYRKFFLATYHVFDEARFMRPGNELGVIETRFGKIGTLICEDVWHSIMGTCLVAAGCHTILIHSASPARGFSGDKPANILRYERMLSALAEEHGIHVAMAMLTGFEGGKGLVGGSLAISPFGQILGQAKLIGDQIIMIPVNPDDTRLARQQTPLASDLTTRWSDLKNIISAIES